MRTPKDRQKIIAALLYCNTQKEAAARAGVSECTITRCLHDPDFIAEYEAQKKSIIKSAAEQIQRSFAPSITALRAITEDEKAGKTARVQAARALLEYGVKLAEYTDLEARITALEKEREGADNVL